MHFELYQASQEAVFKWFGNTYAIMTENAAFTPPADGSPYLKFDYIEASTMTVSLDRLCRVYLGIVQVSVIISPGSGVMAGRKIADDVANRAIDGIMLTVTDSDGLNPVEVGYIVDAGSVEQVVKHDSGWSIPVRFTVRAESQKMRV